MCFVGVTHHLNTLFHLDRVLNSANGIRKASIPSAKKSSGVRPSYTTGRDDVRLRYGSWVELGNSV